MRILQLSGPNSLISRCLGIVHPAGAETAVPVYVPNIPIGELVVPIRPMFAAMIETSTGCSPEEADEQVGDKDDAFRRLCLTGGIPLRCLQTIITGNGSAETMSGTVARWLVETLMPGDAGRMLEDELDLLARLGLGEDGRGGPPALFENLTALHDAAGTPRFKAPGHWRHRHRHRIAYWVERGGKGVWRGESGDWYAQPELAIDYAQMLFVDFHVFTVQLVADHPDVKAAFRTFIGADLTTEPEGVA